jgi:hypothetical protein
MSVLGWGFLIALTSAMILLLVFTNDISNEQMSVISNWLWGTMIFGMLVYIVWYIVTAVRNDRENNEWRKTIKPGDEVAFYQGGNFPDKDCTVESVSEKGTATVRMTVDIDRLYKKKDKK